MSEEEREGEGTCQKARSPSGVNRLGGVLGADWPLCFGEDDLARTLVAVGPGEALLTLAAEMAAGEAAALPVRAAHVGRDVAHVSRGAVRHHGDRAAVNHCGRETRGRG